MPKLILIFLIFATFATAAAQRKSYDYNNLTTDQIAEIKAQRLQYYEAEGARKDAAIKRYLLREARSINANQADYDVSYYGLHVSIFFPTESIKASIDYQLTSQVPALNTVDLDLIQDLIVDSVKVNSQPSPFSHIGAILSITLPTPMNTGQSFSMNVFYHGVPHSGYGYTDGGMGFMNNNGNLVCWTATEPFDSRNWWPCKDTPEDKADSIKLWIECPLNMTAAANGVLQTNTDLGNGRRVFYWKHNYPITTYLVALSVAEFDVVDTTWTYDGHTMPVYSYTFPNAYIYKEVFDTLTFPMLNIYSDAFGIYPFVNEKLANVNCGVYGTMEHQTCSFHDPFSFYDPVYLLIHENAHQWWGDMITCKTFHHVWLNEGFGTYSESIFYEQAYGTSQAYFNHMDVLKYLGGGTIYVEDPLNENIFDGSLSYNKGAWVVHMLRGVLGDSTFFSAIKDWTSSSFRYGSATTQDLSNSISNSVGADMSWFFNQWIYGDGHPEYDISWQCRPDTVNGGFKLEYAVEQVQTGGRLFKMPIRTTLVTTAGNRDTTLWNDNWSQFYSIHSPDSVTGVSFDPQEWILRTVKRIPFTMHVATTVCADAEIGQPYYQKFEAVGGIEPYHWTFFGGDLPIGLDFEDDTVGVLSGIPNYAATFYFTLMVQDSKIPPQERLFSYSVTVNPPSALCGDADANAIVTISDAVYLINYIFVGGPAPAGAGGDPDCNSIVTISDAVYLINYIFAGGPAPCEVCP
ncbi:MAG: M1 family metallopeptidase [Candidatus Zixiibacteriota bacterium]